MKISGFYFVFLSILMQLLVVPLVYGFFESLQVLFLDSSSDFGLNFYYFTFPTLNFTILFSVIIVTSVQETTKSELLASVMNAVWILFIFKETKDAFCPSTFEFILFMFCISLTIPVRIVFRMLYHSENPTDRS